jgi:hypothetical protein
MAFFPTSPTNGQIANVGNISYQWTSTANTWNRVGTTVTQLIDGVTVNITGNLNATGTGQQTFGGRISAAGNVTGANVIANQAITAVGNITTSGNIVASGNANVSVVNASSVNATSQINVGAANITTTQLNITNVVASNAVTSPYASATTLIVSGNALIANANVTGTVLASTANITGNITAGNISATNIGNVAALNLSGIANTVLYGNGVFAAPTGGSGGGGTGNRTDLTTTVGPISSGVTVDVDLTGYKGYALYKINTTGSSWIRVYCSNATRTSDSTRNINTDPQPGAGVLAEIIATSSGTTLISPGALCFNNDSPVSNNIPLAVTNTSASPQTLTITLTVLQLEN